MPGSMARGVAGGQVPGVGRAFLGGQLGALVQRDRHARRVHQQVVLGQEAGEEHAVPLLVGDLLDQPLFAGLDAAQLDGQAAQLRGLGAQGAAQQTLFFVHAGKGFARVTARLSSVALAAVSAASRAAMTVFSSWERRGSDRAGMRIAFCWDLVNGKVGRAWYQSDSVTIVA